MIHWSLDGTNKSIVCKAEPIRLNFDAVIWMVTCLTCKEIYNEVVGFVNNRVYS